MHVLAILGKNFSNQEEERMEQENIRQIIVKDNRGAIIKFLNKNDRRYLKRFKKYKKKHPRAIEKIFA